MFVKVKIKCFSKRKSNVCISKTKTKCAIFRDFPQIVAFWENLNYSSSLLCSPYAATAATVHYALDLLASRLTSEEAYELLAP